MTAEYQFYIRDAAGLQIAELDVYDRIELIPRFNDVGGWKIDTRYDALIPDLDWKGGIIAVRDGVKIFSGNLQPKIGQLKSRWGKGGHFITASGPGDLAFLGNRLALSDPAGAPYTGQEFDTQTDKTETLLKYYVDYNAGPNAQNFMQVTGLTIEADAAAGTTISGNARFDNLLEFCQSLALAEDDLGFRIIDLEFQVYTPSDKTATIVFSEELGNLEEYTYTQKAPKLNYGIAGANDAEGAARTTSEFGNSASITKYGIAVGFINSRDDGVSELNQKITEKLAQQASKEQLKFVGIELEDMQLYDDYWLGDKVTVVVDNEKKEAIIRELRIVIDGDGETVTPVIGTPDAKLEPIEAMFSRDREINERIVTMETV